MEDERAPIIRLADRVLENAELIEKLTTLLEAQAAELGLIDARLAMLEADDG